MAMNISCKFEKASYNIFFVRAVTVKSLYTLRRRRNKVKSIVSTGCYPVDTINLDHSFAFDAPTVWNDLTYDVCSTSTLACFRKKAKILSLQKGFPSLLYKLSSVSLVLTWLCL